MCGLNVVLRDPSLSELTQMALDMQHRGTGPHRVGKYGSTGFAHVRLPIVGLDDEFSSPFEYGGWVFLFVGEIVNFREIGPEARCDIEVLARLWVDHGPECVWLLDGFWSFAAFNKNDPGRVYVVTDFLAKKPLYFRRDRLAISSEILPLTRLGPCHLDQTYMSSVRKWGYHPGDRTWCEQVRKIPAGTLMVLDDQDGLAVWDTEFDQIQPLLGATSMDLAGAIKTAVERRVTASDVPIGLLLSGGLDSSIIYKLASGVRGDITLYHVENDEAKYVDMLNPVEDVVKIALPPVHLDTVLRANEGPVDLGSMMAQYALGQAIDERVVLSGDGADELFGGYRRAFQYDSQRSDVFEELVYYHLPRLDKLMMRGTIELRSPFLARNVVRMALALPRRDRTGKAWLKYVFEGLVPNTIINRPKIPLRSEVYADNPEAWRHKLADRWEEIATMEYIR